MVFSKRTLRSALLFSALAIGSPTVVSAQSTFDSHLPAPAPNLFDAPRFVPGKNFDPIKMIQVYFGVWDEGSLSATDVVAMWIFNFHRVEIGLTPAPSITHTPRFAQGTQTGKSTLDLGVVAEGGIIFSDSTWTYMGGPRVTFVPSQQRFSIYGETLVGGMSFDGGHDFVLMPAAGVIVPLKNSKFSVAGEIGFPIDFFDGGHETARRYMGGFAYRLGK